MAVQSLSMTTAQEVVIGIPAADSQGEAFDPGCTLGIVIAETGPLSPVIEDVIAGDGERVLRSAHVGVATVTATITTPDGSTIAAGTYTIAVGNSGLSPDASVIGAVRDEVR